MLNRLCVSLLLLLAVAIAAEPRRPSPQAVRKWQDRKFGLFIHFGLYSELGGVWKGERVTRGYSEQIMRFVPTTREEYAGLARGFNPQRWDPDAIVRLAEAAGMKFIVLTSKHHDGFNLFATRLSGFNVVDASPYRRDLVQSLADACARRHMPFGVYYSTIDWHDPRATPPSTPPTSENDNLIPKAHEDFNAGQIEELATRYGPLTEIWFDMGQPTPAQSKRFADTVHRFQPDCMVSGRVFNGQGDFTVMGDNSIPTSIIDEPWQTPGSIYHSTWGYRSWQERTDAAGKISEHILKLVQVVSRGGNYLLNIGPKGDGSVVDFEADVLRGIGQWTSANAEAIYDTTPQPFRELDFGYATVKPGKLYLMVSKWPADGRLRLPGLRTPLQRARYLTGSSNEPLTVDASGIAVSDRRLPNPVVVIVADYEGPLEVTPPSIQPAASGILTLDPATAIRYFNYNGRGYYDPPTVWGVRWDVAIPTAGRYRVEGRQADLEIRIAGRKIETETVDLAAADSLPVMVTATAGRRAPIAPPRLKLTPVH